MVDILASNTMIKPNVSPINHSLTDVHYAVRRGGIVKQWQGHCYVTAIWRLPYLLCNSIRVLRLLARGCHSFRIASQYDGLVISSAPQTMSSIDHRLVSWMLSLAHLRYGTLVGHRRRRAQDYRLPKQTLSRSVFLV